MEVGNEPNSSSIPADGGETNHMPNSGCTAIFCRKTRFWVPDLFPATFRLQFMLAIAGKKYIREGVRNMST